MKREIIFRGKRLDNGKWVEGLPCYNINNGLCIQVLRGKVKNGMAVPSILHPVSPETVGQFTGLKDKNGRDVYDGDILRVTEYENIAIGLSLPKKEIENTSLEDCKYQKKASFIGEVVLSESCFHVGYTYLSAFHGDQRFSQPIFEIEVIGNIHDNPELLKTK